MDSENLIPPHELVIGRDGDQNHNCVCVLMQLMLGTPRFSDSTNTFDVGTPHGPVILRIAAQMGHLFNIQGPLIGGPNVPCRF